MRKVYSILTAQIFLTASFAGVCMYSAKVQHWMLVKYGRAQTFAVPRADYCFWKLLDVHAVEGADACVARGSHLEETQLSDEHVHLGHLHRA